MSQLNQFKIVNNDNSKGLKFAWAEGFGDSITINNITIPSAGQDASQNYVANFGGFKRIIRVDFVLQNDGTDKSTDGSSKITLSQQADHLMDTGGVVQGNSTGQYNVTYTVTIYRDGATKEYTGGVEDISVDWDSSNGILMKGSFNLTIGTN